MYVLEKLKWLSLVFCPLTVSSLSFSKPVLTVMVSEMLVDWLKHAFITKFNHIRPSVYERYADVLCQDLASGSAMGRRRARKVCSCYAPFSLRSTTEELPPFN